MKKYFDLSSTEWQDLQNLTFEEIKVEWQTLILTSEKIKISDYEYLRIIEQFSNTGSLKEGIGTGGIFAYKFEYGHDAEFERLLDIFSLPSPRVWIARKHKIKFLSTLFSKTKIYDTLATFLEDGIEEKLTYLYENYTGRHESNLIIPSFLTETAYNYGMYKFCFEYFTKNEVAKITSDFTHAIFENNYDYIVSFTFQGAWNKWFDIHSCSDITFLFISRNKKTIWLLSFSHSD